jgi:type I restriction enzyme S subunit
MKLPVPSLSEQQKLVDECKVIQNSIDLNNKTIQRLEETAQIIYKQRFIDFEFPNEE